MPQEGTPKLVAKLEWMQRQNKKYWKQNLKLKLTFSKNVGNVKLNQAYDIVNKLPLLT